MHFRHSQPHPTENSTEDEHLDNTFTKRQAEMVHKTWVSIGLNAASVLVWHFKPYSNFTRETANPKQNKSTWMHFLWRNLFPTYWDRLNQRLYKIYEGHKLIIIISAVSCPGPCLEQKLPDVWWVDKSRLWMIGKCLKNIPDLRWSLMFGVNCIHYGCSKVASVVSKLGVGKGWTQRVLRRHELRCQRSQGAETSQE